MSFIGTAEVDSAVTGETEPSRIACHPHKLVPEGLRKQLGATTEQPRDPAGRWKKTPRFSTSLVIHAGDTAPFAFVKMSESVILISCSFFETYGAQMADNLPYMVSPGLIPKILGKITEARRPDRFTQDFLETKLSFPGGSARPIIPLLKRIGFLSPDGAPTKLYDSFRNPDTAGAAMAEALRIGYREIFDRNEYAADLSRDKLQALVVEMTGLEKDSRVVIFIVSTFWALKEFANFEAPPTTDAVLVRADNPPTNNPPPPQRSEMRDHSKQMELRVGYTINLNLPETTNPDVFNAIFRALKEHLIST